MVYLSALQRVTQQGPGDAVSPKIVYEAVASLKNKREKTSPLCFCLFFLISFRDSTKAERDTEQGGEC